jgi:phage terminase small subunit
VPLVAGSTAREIRLCADESRSRSKLIKGNPGKRALGSEPQLPQRLEQVPEPPAFLLPEAEAAWKQVAPELVARGRLTVLDLQLFAAFCQKLWPR